MATITLSDDLVARCRALLEELENANPSAVEAFLGLAVLEYVLPSEDTAPEEIRMAMERFFNEVRTRVDYLLSGDPPS